MAGTKEGGAKAAATNKAKYGEDFYRKIGRIGGSVYNKKGGFAANPELARRAGAKGGASSKRRASKLYELTIKENGELKTISQPASKWKEYFLSNYPFIDWPDSIFNTTDSDRIIKIINRFISVEFTVKEQ